MCVKKRKIEFMRQCRRGNSKLSQNLRNTLLYRIRIKSKFNLITFFLKKQKEKNFQVASMQRHFALIFFFHLINIHANSPSPPPNLQLREKQNKY